MAGDLITRVLSVKTHCWPLRLAVSPPPCASGHESGWAGTLMFTGMALWSLALQA